MSAPGRRNGQPGETPREGQPARANFRSGAPSGRVRPNGDPRRKIGRRGEVHPRSDMLPRGESQQHRAVHPRSEVQPCSEARPLGKMLPRSEVGPCGKVQRRGEPRPQSAVRPRNEGHPCNEGHRRSETQSCSQARLPSKARRSSEAQPRRRGAGAQGAVLPALRAAIGLIAAALLLAAAPARSQSGGGFSAAFDAALANDAEYRASRFELQAREQNVPIARASLLPSIAASYSESRVRGERESLNSLGQEFQQQLDYRNPVGALQFRQPLLNMEAVYRYQSARSQVDGARLVFVARGQELLDRLGTAYVQRLFAEEVVALAQAQVDAFAAQATAAERRFAAGEATRTDVAEAAASLAFGRAQLVEATDQRDIAARNLARITGLAATPLRGLAEDTRALPLPYRSVADWIDIAFAGNPNIQARRHLIEAARHDVSRTRAGHLPRVDLVANAVNSQSESISTLNQQVRQYSAGVQISVPIFSGGGVDASVTQALAEVSRVESQLEAELRLLEVDIRRQFQATQTGAAKVQALNDALAASAVALEGAQRGLVAGVRTTVDVLDATRRLFLVRRDLAQARYEVLLARLRLQTLAGLPLADIVADIDRHLTAPVAGVAVASAR